MWPPGRIVTGYTALPSQMLEGVLVGGIGAVVGFFLNEASHVLRGRRTDQRAVRRVIYSLLDFYITLSEEASFLEAVERQGQLGPEARAFLAESSDIPEADLGKLRQRLREAAADVAEHDPLLALNLLTAVRNSESAPKLNSSEALADFFNDRVGLNASLYRLAANGVGGVAVELAAKHDRGLGRRITRSVLNHGGERPKNWDHILDSISNLDRDQTPTTRAV